MTGLSANEGRFRALVTASTDIAYAMSPDWELMYEVDGRGLVKSNIAPIAGWREKNLYAEDLPMVNDTIVSAIANKVVFELEHRIWRPDGSIGWVFSRAVPILDEAGEIVEWFGVASDISARKAAEEELQELRSLYESVTSSTPDLIYVFTLDYKFSYANKALLEMWGKTWEQAVGKGLLENGYQDWHARMHEREIDQVIATGLPVRGEVAFPHAVLGSRTYDYILNPVFDKLGKVKAVSGTTRDVTERKAQELENLRLSHELAALNDEAQTINEELRATNEELQISQDMLSNAHRDLAQIIDMLPASVVVIRGGELVVEMINDSNLKYWNKTREEVVGRAFPEVLPDLAGQPFAGQLRRVMDTGEVIDVKESLVLFTSEDGSVRETYVDYTYQPIFDQSGNCSGVLVMSFEITDQVISRKLLEHYAKELSLTIDQLSLSNNKLIKSEARFKFLIQEAPVAIGVLHGRALIVETVNTKLLEVWGKDSSIIGLPLSEALPEIRDQPFQEILEKVFDSGEAFNANEIRAVLEHNGDLKEFFFNLVYQPVAGSLEEAADILIVAVDVTQQVNSRKAVERSEQHFRSLADLVPAKISNAKASGEVTFFNRNWLDFAGMNFEDLRDFGYHEMMHPEEIPKFQAGLAVAAERGVSHVSEMRFKNTEGKYIWHLNIASPIMDDQGKIAMWVGSTTDIQHIKEEEQRKNDFIGMVSHELKTPLTSLSGYLQLLRAKFAKSDEQLVKNALEQSLKQTGKMTAMVNSFLNVTRLESGQIPIHKALLQVNELFQEVEAETAHMISTHPISFWPIVAEVMADHDKIGQVLSNLVSNAVKYSSPGTAIRVTAEVSDQLLTVAVTDEGMGIAEKDLLHVFERFYRVETGGNISGFGIGLYLCAEIIKRHDGSIWAESEIGKGSTFSFNLPLIQVSSIN